MMDGDDKHDARALDDLNGMRARLEIGLHLIGVKEEKSCFVRA
jgi:hypothetical protein